MEKKNNIIRFPILPNKIQISSCPFTPEMEIQIKKNAFSPRKEKMEAKIQINESESAKLYPFSFDNFDRHFRKTLPDFLNRRKSRSPETQLLGENRKFNKLISRFGRISRSPEATYERGRDMITDFINFQKLENILKIFAIRLMNQSMFKNLINKKNGNKVRSFEFIENGCIEKNFDLKKLLIKIKAANNDFLSEEEFNMVKSLFIKTTQEFEERKDKLTRIMNLFEKFRERIVTKSKTPIEYALNSIPGGINSLIKAFDINSKSNSMLAHSSKKKEAVFLNIINFLTEKSTANEFQSLLLKCKTPLSEEYLFNLKRCFITCLREFEIDNGNIFKIKKKLYEIKSNLTDEENYASFLEREDFSNILQRFYTNIISYEILRKMFKRTSKNCILNHCSEMLKFCLKSNSTLKPCDLAPIHQKFINNQHYKAMQEAFVKTLNEFNMPPKYISYIVIDMDYYKYDIVKEKCLLEKIGGFKNMEFIVKCLYLDGTMNVKLKRFFENVNLPKLITYQSASFSQLFDKKKVNSGFLKDLRILHKDLNIKEDEFDYFVTFMGDSAKRLYSEDEDFKDEIIECLMKCKKDVLNLDP